MSAKKAEGSLTRSSKYVEPTIKLQNFVAADPNKLLPNKAAAQNQSNRFTSGGVKGRKVSEISDKDEDDDDEYSEDFDSLSRS